MIVPKRQLVGTAAAAALLISGLTLTPGAGNLAHAESTQEAGKKVAFTRSKGNCLACHMIQGGESPGNIAPPLIAMQSRYPSKQAIRDQIWDATAANPDTFMPPFGKHGILTDKEIDQVVEFIWAQ
jgi:sulfur-oxidizing protein SoxX